MAAVYGKELLANALGVINGVEQLRNADLKRLFEEAKGYSETDLVELATELQKLDLTNDELEAKIETIALAGAPMAAFVLRLLKIFFPKRTA